MLTLVVWLAFLTQERAATKEQSQAVASAFANNIETTVRTYENAVLRMAQRWEKSGGTPRDLWEFDAQNYANDLPGFAAFDWIDETYRIRWSVPEIGRKNFVGYEAGNNPQYRAYLDRVREAGRLLSSGVFESNAGITGISFYVPLQTGGEFSGFAGGLLDVEEFLRFQHLGYASDLHVQVLVGNRELFRSYTESRDVDPNELVTGTAKVGENEILINAFPTVSFIQKQESLVPRLILALGLVLAALTAIFMHQSNRMSASRRRSDQRFHGLFSESRDGIVIRAVSDNSARAGKILDANQAYLDMIGYDRQELDNLTIEDLVKRPEDQERIRLSGEQLNIRGYSDDCNFELCCKDGSFLPVNVRLWTLIDEADGNKQTISIIRDLSETQ